MSGKAILTDVTRCIGCLECVAACKKEYDLPMDIPRIWQRNDGLSSNNWTSILEKPHKHFIRKQCRHCLDPACVASCPVGALHKTEAGAVVYDREKCIGCRYCMMACPFNIPCYDWDHRVPYVQKCSMCYERIRTGKQPACTEVCPTEATVFGDRDDLIAEAHRRIRQNPGKYLDRIWGEHEVGGTSVLYLSDIDLDFLSYEPDLQMPLPQTTEAAMKGVLPVFFGMGAVLLGLSWIIKRRQRLMNTNGGEE